MIVMSARVLGRSLLVGPLWISVEIWNQWLPNGMGAFVMEGMAWEPIDGNAWISLYHAFGKDGSFRFGHETHKASL